MRKRILASVGLQVGEPRLQHDGDLDVPRHRDDLRARPDQVSPGTRGFDLEHNGVVGHVGEDQPLLVRLGGI